MPFDVGIHHEPNASHGIGSDSQRPFAIVIVGGLVGALAINVFLLPTLYVFVPTTIALVASVPQGRLLYGQLMCQSGFCCLLIEQFAKKRTSINDAIVGCCFSELRTRRLRMDFSTYEVVKASFPNQRFQFKLADRQFVTPEMVKPV